MEMTGNYRTKWGKYYYYRYTNLKFKRQNWKKVMVKLKCPSIINNK